MKNEKMTALFLSLVLCFALILPCFTSCKLQNPLTIETMDRFVSENGKLLEEVCDFLHSKKEEHIYIDNANGEYFAELEYRKFDSNEFVTDVKKLWDLDCEGIIKDVDEFNSISFCFWSSFQDVESGILYQIESDTPPSTAYLTELCELSEPGWYYYVADYNQWRVGNRP